MRRLLAATAVAVLALPSAGCGDDDNDSVLPGKSSEETTKDAAADEAADAGDEPADTEADDSGDEPADTEAPDTEEKADEADVDDLSAKCAELEAKYGDSFDDEVDFAALAEAFDEVKQYTPDSIDDDLDLVGGGFREVAELIDAKGGDPAVAFSDPEILAKLQEIGTPEFQAANDRLTAYFDKACPSLNS